MHLVIDCRMINKSGIGTYIKNIIPGLIKSRKYKITCLGYVELANFDWYSEVNFIELKSAIFSISEQFELPLKIPTCDIFWTPNWNVPLLYIKAKKRITTIHDVYHLANSKDFSLFKISFAKLLMNFIKIRYHKIITVSNFSKSEIIKYTSISSERIKVSYLAVEDDFDKLNEIKKIDEDFILFVGNVKPHKNLKLCLEAIKLIDNKYVKFYIVGQKEGFLTGDIQLLNAMENVNSQVVFTGRISDSELKNYYKQAKLFLFPSTYEGFGLPILEAMKFKLPIISSDKASIPEVAGDSVIYFDSSDLHDLIVKLNDFFEGKIKCSIADYEYQLNKFNWNNTISRHLDILDSL